MMDCTDRHCRYFMRLLAPHVLLYSEMVTANALLHGDRERFLAFDEKEHPLAMQLGGSDPDHLRQCAVWVEQAGYDEINLNVGCPSDRVQSAQIGACLMKQPQLVARCVSAMQQAVSIPVTVKTRIGVDDDDSDAFLQQFIETVAEAGCQTFIVHARKAWLQGLSPKQNRTVPAINYEKVYQLKQKYPQLTIILNGEIKTIAQAEQHLQYVDGIMIGREAYHNPYFLAQLEAHFFQQALPSRAQVLQQYLPYIIAQLNAGIRLKQITRHIIGLFQGQPGAKAWRRHLSEHAHLPGADIALLERAALF
jgi:tRNA-dihydrouridine synthase A